MKPFLWNAEKNRELIRDRNISLEEIVLIIQLGGILDIYEHFNQTRYPGQQVLVV